MNIRRRPPVGPVPDEHVDPVRAVEAKLLVAYDRLRDAELAGNEAFARVARRRIDDLLDKRAEMVAARGQS